MSSGDKAIVLGIEAASVEIDRAIERMRRDQAAIEQLKAETRAMLNELMAPKFYSRSGTYARVVPMDMRASQQ